ncbi:MAG: hypothetical protein HQ564_06295, partial [Candidatus Saganbacteria bacterium]|nr:hypothetical protein [Candidatus Saganbacteria bacterium]
TEICTQIAKETGRQLGILHGAGGHAGGHVYIHQFGEVTLTLEHKQTKKQIILKVRANSTEQELDLHDYEISQIEAEQFGRHEFGAVGGGSTRPNNLGFGLRDLISISSSPQKSGTNKLAELFPPEVGGLFIRGALKYFYLKMVQQADLDMLFVCRMRKEVAQAGNLGDMAGSLPLLVQALGGNLQAFESAKAAFFESYQKFYSLSLNKKVRPSFFESWDSSKNRPKLIYKSPSEDGGEEEVINGMFPKSASVKRAA